MNDPIGIALVGCGTVGGGTGVLLTRDAELLRQRSGLPLELKYVVDLNFGHAQELGLNSTLYTKNLDDALGDDSVSIIIELVGGTTFAKTVVEKALSAGKNVVTANKALLAHYGAELMALARKNEVCIGFEASCGGGIPIIRALTDGLMANDIDALFGIVNGTCNYILSEMTTNGQSYMTALTQAQKDGLAEADPTLDVSGMDSAHKITIMSALAFGVQTDLDAVSVSGIDTLDLFDITTGKELGYIIKLIAFARKTDKGITMQVKPAFISTDHPLAWVSGPFNAVSVYGHAVGHTMYYGRGAGASPTASAVVSDVISVANGTLKTLFDKEGIWPDRQEKATMLADKDQTGRYYLRMNVEDKPGVVASITSILSRNGISITSVLQREAVDGYQGIPLVITTHKTDKQSKDEAVKEINDLIAVKDSCIVYPIIDEHEENFA